MRKPSEYLPAALKGLRSRLMPDCSASLLCGGRSATVTRVGTTALGEDALAGSDVAEGMRVLASAADFPGLGKGRLVSLDGEWRVVVSARTDPAAATLSLALSASLTKVRADYRRPGTKLAQPLDVLAVEGETAEPGADAFAPTVLRTWTVAIPEDAWPEPTDPQVGDLLELSPEDAARCASVAVRAVERRDGFWILSCRARR